MLKRIYIYIKKNTQKKKRWQYWHPLDCRRWACHRQQRVLKFCYVVRSQSYYICLSGCIFKRIIHRYTKWVKSIFFSQNIMWKGKKRKVAFILKISSFGWNIVNFHKKKYYICRRTVGILYVILIYVLEDFRMK